MSEISAAQNTVRMLFKDEETVLKLLIRDLRSGSKAQEAAQKHIFPILDTVEKNASQAMDPTYVAYLVQYAFEIS